MQTELDHVPVTRGEWQQRIEAPLIRQCNAARREAARYRGMLHISIGMWFITLAGIVSLVVKF